MPIIKAMSRRVVRHHLLLGISSKQTSKMLSDLYANKFIVVLFIIEKSDRKLNV